MFRKIQYDIITENDILNKIRKYIPIIKGESKKIGQNKLQSDLERYTSEDYLINLMKEKGDVAVNEVSNKYGFSDLPVTSELIPFLQNHYKNRSISESGHFYYYDTGFMSWHTNSDVPCMRVYITYTDDNNKSFFRYYDTKLKKVITDYDKKGINVREFDITGKPPFLWHCIGSNCNRYSFGFRVY
jgi:hypothetical protein